MAQRRRKNRKVVSIRRGHNINIGVIIFGLMLIYIVANVFIYMTQSKTGIYEVVEGSTVSATNHSYTGFILRDEKVGKAPKNGYMNFYVKEGTKVSPITSLYSIDETGTVSELLQQSANSESTLSKENLQDIKRDICSFVADYDPMEFSSVYDFKYDLESTLLEYVNINALQSLNESKNEQLTGNIFNIYKPKSSGIVEYYTDGFEGMKEDDINKDTFNIDEYKKNICTTNSLVEQDSNIYKVLGDEEWNIYIPLSSEEAMFFNNTSVVNIKFIKDNISCKADFDIINNDGEIFGKLTLYKYMVRYADLRFVDIDIIVDETKGLKIPKSSVVEKEFYTVPLEYASDGGDSKETGFYKKTSTETGEETVVFITPTIFEEDDNYYYLDPDEFDENTWLVKPKSKESFSLKATSPLKGVYNVNLGYCVFEKIEILAESGNYFIINSGTVKGPAIYDRIVLDGDKAEPGKLINR